MKTNFKVHSLYSLSLYLNTKVKLHLVSLKIGFEKLKNLSSADEKITFALIEKYQDFKIGEIWERIDKELLTESVIPTAADQDLLKAIQETTRVKARTVRHEQQKYLEEKKEVSHTLNYIIH